MELLIAMGCDLSGSCQDPLPWVTHNSPIERRGHMGKHPIRYVFLCPLRIALTFGQVAHETSGVKAGEEGVCGHFGQNGQNSPKSGPSKYRISVSQEKRASGFCMDVDRSFPSLLQQRLRFKAQ